MTVLTIWQEAGVTAIACYNDGAPIASIFAPQLSTVRINTAGLGRYVAALALGVVEGTIHLVARLARRSA